VPWQEWLRRENRRIDARELFTALEEQIARLARGGLSA
jgi:hypothetical protein